MKINGYGPWPGTKGGEGIEDTLPKEPVQRTYPKQGEARMKKYFILGALLLVAAILAACSTTTPTPVDREVPVTVEVPVEVEVTRVVEVTAVPVAPVAEAPFIELWEASAHADKTAEAFAHWNEDDPKEVPTSCAKCHSATGFRDFVGADGSAAGTVEAAGPIEDVINCEACHNPNTQVMTEVAFPSGAVVTNLGPEARCMQCHQGRASMVQVNESIAEVGLDAPEDADATSEELGFTNIHYYAAAVSRYGTQVKGGYEYDGKTYDVLFDHVPGMDSCTDCHDSHSLQIKIEACQACHAVENQEDLRNIRMQSSTVDYDGDGDVAEGVAFEIDGVREKLFAAIQAYAANVLNAPIGYSATAYPYFFVDPNGDGTLDEAEAISDNRYHAWSPRLLKAAYNFQTSLKDPGAYAHGGKYIIELLYDSLEDLNSALGDNAVDMTGMRRIDAGHFAGSTEAFRHWDAEGMVVPGTCAKCHSGGGLPQFLANGTNIAVGASNGFLCESCHTNTQDYARYEVNEVVFPSGARLSFGEGVDSNLCIQCHQGRESTVSVDRAITNAKVGDDEASESLRFRNIHYFAAGATLFGNDAKGAYQYANQQYVGRFLHGDIGPQVCADCHEAHNLEVEFESCTQCHRGVEEPQAIRMDETDYDGDGDVAEGIAGEIATLQEALYARLVAYSTEELGTAIRYDAHAYPYFFADTNGNGEADEGEGGYAGWSPRLLRAAYNYQYSQKDPGAFAHNAKYVLQALYDSLQDLGGDVTGMTRPAAPAP
jgi:hypothetical protein